MRPPRFLALSGQVLLNGLLEEREPRVSDQGVLCLPALIIQQIVLETAKADALPAKDVAGLQPSAEEQIDQKLITVVAQRSIRRRLGIEIPFQLGGDPAELSAAVKYTTIGVDDGAAKVGIEKINIGDDRPLALSLLNFGKFHRQPGVSHARKHFDIANPRPAGQRPHSRKRKVFPQPP